MVTLITHQLGKTLTPTISGIRTEGESVNWSAVYDKQQRRAGND
jgi:hypothetical protein